MSTVVVYTSPMCGYCHQAKQYLAQRGIPFTEHDVAADPAAAAEMVHLSGQRGVPVIVLDGQVVVGFDRPRLDQLLAARTPARPRLGLSVASVADVAEGRDLRSRVGAYVGKVRPSSPGDRAGLVKGDVIIELAGRPVSSADDLEAVLSTLTRGQTVSLVFVRDGQETRVDVTP